MGNTVVVVEHDEDTMRAADHLVDFGPGPGVRGGEVVAAGSYAEIVANPASLTGQYLSGVKQIAIPPQRRPRHRQDADHRRRPASQSEKHHRRGSARPVRLRHRRQRLRQKFARQRHSQAGIAGSAPTRSASDGATATRKKTTSTAKASRSASTIASPAAEHIDKVIDIDQSPIGRTPRSNPATYIKVFDEIRALFAEMPEAKIRGYQPGRFSFNKPGGRCEACEGNGSNRLEMDFLADVWVTCPVCEGRRFNRETLQVRFKGKSIHDVLEMDVQEALEHFQNVPKIRGMLQTLHDVGLDYLKLGQPAPTLSGGEAQRIKLARELCRRATGRTLYILDEPTTGLHFDDIQKLLQVLHGFVEAGNTVVVIEHNLDVIKTADWLIDLGPEGGSGGGEIVCRRHAGSRSPNARHLTPGRLCVPCSAPQRGDEWPQTESGEAQAESREPASRSTHADRPGSAAAQLKQPDGRAAAREDDRLLRPERLGQKLAGAGYDLRRGTAALHRIAVGLRPAVSRPDAEAEGRARQRPVAGHQHRAEDDQQKPALDRRHRHRGLRLPARPLRPPRPAVLPRLPNSHRHADGRRDHREDPVAAGRDASCT